MIAAALSIQDPRERPEEHREAADELHRRFDVAGQRPPRRSSPCGTTCASSSGRCRRTSSAGCAAPSTSTTSACASGRTSTASCARSPATSACAPAARPAIPTTSTRRVLAGLLSHIGIARRRRAGELPRRPRRDVRDRAAARCSPSSRRAWVMAAELVETNRLWARRVAAIAAGVGRAPRRPPRQALVRRAALGRRGGRGRRPPRRSRCTGCRSSTGPHRRARPRRPRRWPASCSSATPSSTASGTPTTRSSAATRRSSTGRRAGGSGAARRPARRRAQVERFYDERVPADVVVDAPLRPVVEGRPAPSRDLLDLDRRRAATGGVAVRARRLPRHAGARATSSLPLRYRFEPGEPLDGVTVHVPLLALNQVADDGLRLADPRLPRASSSAPSSHAAQGRPPRADPGGRDRRRRRSTVLGRRQHGRLVDALAAALSDGRRRARAARRLRPAARCRRTCG